jgi:multiple sugar transport system substrate-binding protein
MLHGFQLGPLLQANVLRPIDDLLANKALSNPALDTADFIQRPFKTLAFHNGKQYGFLNWNYNQVYWARGDLLTHAGEQAAFKAKYGYDLGPAKTLEQMRDIAEFFTRKKGEKLGDAVLDGNFYGIVLEGVRGGSTFLSLWNNFIRSFGGDIVDAEGRPTFDRPENVQAIRLWAELWKFSPPGTAEYSLVDIPTVMGNGIAAQTIAWSDFVLGVDREGISRYAGKFVYGPVPPKAGLEAKRAVEAEPSITALSASSKNPEATFLFLQWLVEKKQQDKLIEVGRGGVPVRESSWNAPLLKEGQLKGLFVAMRESLDVAEAKPKMPKFFEVYDALTGISQEIGLGKLTPEAGAAKGQAEMLKICSKCLL